MPVFYVLDDSEVVAQIFSDMISSRLEADLVELTRRPLIIRTDGVNILAISVKCSLVVTNFDHLLKRENGSSPHLGLKLNNIN